MPTITQYEVVKQQCNAMRAIGYTASFEIQSMGHGAAPKIKIGYLDKIYHFSDPDWDVVSMQIATLYTTINDKSSKATPKQDSNL